MVILGGNMEKEDLIKLKNGFKEIADILDEILSIEDNEENKDLMEQKVAMFLYKMMTLQNIFE